MMNKRYEEEMESLDISASLGIWNKSGFHC